MEARLSIAIVFSPQYPARRVYVQDMLERFGRDKAKLVGFDVFPSLGNDLWENHRRAWAAGLRYDSTHHLVLEDDLGICKNFIPGAIAALTAAGERCVNFYANRGVMEEAKAQGTSWVPIRWGAWGQAICLPRPWVREFLLWDAENLRQDWWSYDARIGLWAWATDPFPASPIPNPKWWWVTAPSLIDHVGAADSVIGYSNRQRVARWYIGDGDPLAVDWHRGLDAPLVKDTGTRHGWDDLFQKGVWAKKQPWMAAKGWRVG